MPTESVWSSLEVAKLLVSVSTPLMVLVLGYWINTRLKSIEQNRQQERDERQKKEEQEREEREREYDRRKKTERLEAEERQNEIERRHTPHMEVGIDCRFFGPKDNQFLAAFLLIADNRGHVVHRFPSIQLRVRGLRKDEPFSIWEEQKPRALFRQKLLETEVVPPGWNFIFVEPGVAQKITFTTLIPADYSLILARAEFHYDTFTPHSVEMVFAVAEGPNPPVQRKRLVNHTL